MSPSSRKSCQAHWGFTWEIGQPGMCDIEDSKPGETRDFAILFSSSPQGGKLQVTSCQLSSVCMLLCREVSVGLLGRYFKIILPQLAPLRIFVYKEELNVPGIVLVRNQMSRLLFPFVIFQLEWIKLENFRFMCKSSCFCWHLIVWLLSQDVSL